VASGWEHRSDGAGLRWEYREDRGALLPAHRRSDGTLLVEGFAAKEGVLEYRRADGSVRREFVPASTLKRAAAGLARAPVTLLHPDPDEYPDGVTPENHAKLTVGDTDGEVVIGDGGFTRVKMAVRRKDAIEAVDDGTRELSPGYKVKLDPTPGTHPEHGRYDAVQVDRVYNHLAIVPVARGGHEVHLRADGAVATTVIRADSATTAGSPARGPKMLSFILQALALLGDTERYDSEEVAGRALVDRIRGHKTRADAAETEARTELGNTVKARDAEKARADSAERDRDQHKARADAAEAELAKLKAEAKTRADADERKRLEPLCKALRVDAAQHPELPKLKRALATAHHGAELPKDWTEAHVDAAVQFALRDHAEGREAGRSAFAPAGPGSGRADGQARGHRAPPVAGSPKGGSLYQRALARTDGFRRQADQGGDA
jgi:hypothetical protein